MYRLFVIAKNNMKKQKGDMITFFILTFLAALLIFDAACALMGMGKVLDERFRQVNGAHFLLFSHDTPEEKECIKKAITEQECIIDYEGSPCIIMIADHKNASKKEYSQYKFIAGSFEHEPKYMNSIKGKGVYKENDILLSLNMQTSYKIGDTIQIKLGEHVYDLNVAGYVEDPYFCSTINLTVYYTLMSDKMMEKMKENDPELVGAYIENKGVMDETYLSSDYSTSDLEKAVTDRYKDLLAPYMEQHPERTYTDYLCVNWQMMRGGSQFVPMIIMAVMLLFAVIVIIIAVIIISFSIKNFIQRNMKNTGILEAAGYTVSELRAALSFQIVSLSFLGALVGTAAGVVTFGMYADVLTIAVGLTWNQGVNIAAIVMTVIVPTFVVFLVSRAASLTYKKISVLDALRGGISAHNFRKNRFSFERTPLPVSLVISLKETFGAFGRNLTMALIVAVITISLLIGFGMYENFGADPANIIRLFGFENATAVIASSEDIGDELRSLDKVDNVLELNGLDLSVKKAEKKK